MTVTHDYDPTFMNKVEQRLVDMKDGAGMIAYERRRQVEKEKWSNEHDDKYSQDQLSKAAISYIISSLRHSSMFDDSEDLQQWLREVPSSWPWSLEWFKPTTRIRNLVKAGALIAAEIDRLKRLEDANNKARNSKVS